MALKIDGYTPADKKIATELGTTFHYRTPYGEITIIAKMTGRDNKPFVRAFQKLQRLHTGQENRGEDNAEQQNRDYAECYHDHVVIRWSTTVKSDGVELQATRENFVDLMTSEALGPVFVEFMREAAKADNFRAVEEQAAAKN